MIGAVLGGVRIDGHAADGIDRAGLPMRARDDTVVMFRRHACTLSLIPLGGI